MKTILPVKVIFILIGFLTFCSGAGAQDKKAVSRPGMAGHEGASCQEACQKRSSLQEQLRNQDAELEDLLNKMNAAPGEQKIQLMAKVVNRLVRQRLSMHKRLQEGHPGMAGCPLMQSE